MSRAPSCPTFNVDRGAGPWLSLQSSGCVENQKQRLSVNRFPSIANCLT